MTKDQLKLIKFHMVSHFSAEDCHTSVYESEGPVKIKMQVSVEYEDMQPTDNVEKAYMYDGKVYDTVDELVEALKDVEYEE